MFFWYYEAVFDAFWEPLLEAYWAYEYQRVIGRL